MSINLTQLRTELGNFYRDNNKVVESMVYHPGSQLSPYCRQLTRIKGEFPALHSVTNNVVQGFVDEWNAIGDTTFRVNELKAYHQKVNYEIKPFGMEHSWLALLAQENLSKEQMPISRYIMERELAPKVRENVADLEINGVYDANDLATYGKSMNGIKKILEDGIVNADNPMYKIPLTALTDSNIVDEVTKFERGLPNKVKRQLPRIFMSTSNMERYVLRYEELYGAHTQYTEERKMRTRLQRREIVGLDFLDGSDLIFTTVDGNMLKLIDLFNAPQMTDIQVLDYSVKLFMDWWLGYGFYINQLVFVSTYDGSSGLGSGSGLDAYYGTLSV